MAAAADDLAIGGQLITCKPNRSDAASVLLDNLHFGANESYAWARANVHVSMRDGSIKHYTLQGRADPISKQLTVNHKAPGFSYPGFACTVSYPAINAVHNCGGSSNRRSCEVGLNIFGTQASFAVSLTAQRMTVRQASAP